MIKSPWDEQIVDIILAVNCLEDSSIIADMICKAMEHAYSEGRKDESRIHLQAENMGR